VDGRGIGYLDRIGTNERTFTVGTEHGAFTPHDNGGRRSWIDRRRFSYSCHIPERRSGIERRKLEGRRFGYNSGVAPFIDRRRALESFRSVFSNDTQKESQIEM
jgi:hypothetical protein